MKKHILMGVALLSLFAASCSNDDFIDNGTEVVTGKAITLNATINNGADTRLTYTDDGSSMNVAWSNEESFTMYKGTNGTSSTFTKTAESGNTFKGDDIEGDGSYYAVYGGDHISNTAGVLSIDLTGAQVGTSAENGIKEFMLATADALNSATTLTFNHKLTVLKMTLTLPEDVTGTVSMVTVSGLHNKATYDLSKTTGAYAYADDGKGAITATNGGKGFTIGSDHTITAYVAVFPENVTANQVKLIANVGFNDYAYTITNARTLTAGKVVPVSASLALVEKNLKSAYTKKDYFYWDAYTYVTNGNNEFSEGNYGYHTGENVTASHSCALCPTDDQMMMYIGAGVYWDDGSTSGDGYYDGNVQTYTANGSEFHAGLWVMKKAYISSDVTGKTHAYTSNGLFKEGRPAASEIGKYFFLPATGYCSSGYYFYVAGSKGYYWSSSSGSEKYAFRLYFDKSSAYVNSGYRNGGYLPMIAE